MPSIPNTVEVVRGFILGPRGKLLVLKRPLDKRYRAGQWEVPGGKLNGGEVPQDALLREIEEETGYQTKLLKHRLFSDSYQIKDGGSYKGCTCLSSFSILCITGGKLAISAEHIAGNWLKFDEILSLDLTPPVARALTDESVRKELREYLW